MEKSRKLKLNFLAHNYFFVGLMLVSPFLVMDVSAAIRTASITGNFNNPAAWAMLSVLACTMCVARKNALLNRVFMMFLFLLLVPLAASGWSTRLFGLLISLGFIGIMLEDFLWFVINPKYSLKKFNSKDAYWYPWIKIGKFEMPVIYAICFLVSLLSWFIFL